MWEEKLSHALLSSGDKFSTAELPRNLGFYRNFKAFLTRYQGVTLPRSISNFPIQSSCPEFSQIEDPPEGDLSPLF